MSNGILLFIVEPLDGQKEVVMPWSNFADLGAEAPDFFIDPFGNLCRKDNTIVFHGKNNSK